MIECSLLKMRRYNFFESQVNKIKYGRYLNSFFWDIPGFGKITWVVAVNILVDYEKHIAEGMSFEEIVEECIKYLNTPPKSKYGKKRKRKLLFGEFKKKPYKFFLKEKDDKKYIQAILMVSDRKRKSFWGEGPKIYSRK